MEMQVYKKGIEKIHYQRNVFAFFGSILLVSNLLLAAFLFVKRERVVVVPPVVEKEFWVEGNCLSPSYLEQFGMFLSQLLLNKSPDSVSLQNQILMRYVSPSYSPAFGRALELEKSEMLNQKLSYLFFPNKVQVIPKMKQVILEGERIVYLAEEEFMKEPMRYLLSFDFLNGKLLLRELKREEIGQ